MQMVLVGIVIFLPNTFKDMPCNGQLFFCQTNTLQWLRLRLRRKAIFPLFQRVSHRVCGGRRQALGVTSSGIVPCRGDVTDSSILVNNFCLLAGNPTQAVDLYVLERAFISTHENADPLVNEVMRAYKVCASRGLLAQECLPASLASGVPGRPGSDFF